MRAARAVVPFEAGPLPWVMISSLPSVISGTSARPMASAMSICSSGVPLIVSGWMALPPIAISKRSGIARKSLMVLWGAYRVPRSRARAHGRCIYHEPRKGVGDRRFVPCPARIASDCNGSECNCPRFYPHIHIVNGRECVANHAYQPLIQAIIPDSRMNHPESGTSSHPHFSCLDPPSNESASSVCACEILGSEGFAGVAR